MAFPHNISWCGRGCPPKKRTRKSEQVESCTVAINDCDIQIETKPGKKNQEIGLASMENELKKKDRDDSNVSPP